MMNRFEEKKKRNKIDWETKIDLIFKWKSLQRWKEEESSSEKYQRQRRWFSSKTKEVV